MDGTLAAGDLERLRKDFSANPAYRLAQNAVTRVTVDDVAINREIVNSIDHSLSTTLDDWKVTNQERSGRCWLFAGLNLLRVGVMRKMRAQGVRVLAELRDVLGQARARQLLPRGDHRDRRPRPRRPDGRLPAGDGGRRRRPVEHVRRPGGQARPGPQGLHAGDAELVEHRPDELDPALPAAPGRARRSARPRPSGLEAARAAKAEIMQVVYRVLCIHLGTPPERFDWQWTDKDKKFHRDGVLTPQEFAAKYVDLPVSDYVCLVNDPRPSSPIGRTFTVEYLGNVIGAPPVTYLNVDMQVIKDIAAATIAGRRAGLVRLRRRPDDEQRLRVLGRRALRPAVGLRRRRSTWTRPPGSPTTRPR